MKGRVVDNLPRAMSGPGINLLEKVHRPLLSVSTRYDRVSSYFSAYSFVHILSELESLWQKGGKVRLILSPADQGIMGEAAEGIREDYQKGKDWKMQISEIINHLNTKSGRVVGLKEAIAQGLLEVSVAQPKTDLDKKYPHPPNFHSKFAIYHLEQKETNWLDKWSHNRRAIKKMRIHHYNEFELKNNPFVVFHGSVNETGQGWEINIEDLSTHRSWINGELDVACYFADRFELIWSGLAPDVEMLSLTEVFKDEIEKVITDVDETKFTIDVDFLLKQQSKIPYSVAFSDKMWLFPHQARVANMAINSTHIKSMFCDEVGLGKTFEALNVVEFKLTSKSVNKVLIAVPASLLEQWAITVNTFLKRDCRLYRAGKYEDWKRQDSESILDVDEEEITILSSHWLRRQSSEKVRQILNEYDLLILDEAHHARCHDWDQSKGTKLWERLFEAKNEIENILLLTATPHQTSQNDYIGLLGLLIEIDEKIFHEIDSIQKLVTGEQKWSMQKALELLTIIISRFDYCKRFISHELNQKIIGITDSGVEVKTQIVRSFRKELIPLLMYKCSTISQNTIRHTRGMIKDEFEFPKVHAENVIVELGTHSQLISKLNDFISLRMGGNGFLKAIYSQRCVSSLQAMKVSLENRLNKHSDRDEENEFFAEGMQLKKQSSLSIEERGRIKSLIRETEHALSDFGSDPKILKLDDLIVPHLNKSRQIIVFSRFTATTRAIEEHFHETAELSIARYDGEYKRIRYPNQKEPTDVSREEIKSEMFDKKVDIIVCSDAASEGLNLQSSSVLINVDVPWNPARLLQRIGRIDRLGQEADEIFVYNLLYNDSIELQMYSVLDERQTDGIRLLGEQPELFSTAASREMFTPDYLEVERRVDDIQNDLRTKSTTDILDIFSPIGPLKFINVLNHDGELSLDPASGENFILNLPEIRAKEIDLSLASEDAKLGLIIDGKNIPHAICLKLNDDYLPLTLSAISILIEKEKIPEEEWTNLTDCVTAYARDFGNQNEINAEGLKFVKLKI